MNDTGGDFHWILFEKGLEPVEDVPGLRLEAACDGEFLVDLAGGTQEMASFFPGTSTEGAGLAVADPTRPVNQVPLPVADAAVSHETFKGQFASPQVLVSGALRGTGHMSLVGDGRAQNWTFINDRAAVDFRGGPGTYEVATDYASVDGGLALVMVGMVPLHGFGGATQAWPV